MNCPNCGIELVILAASDGQLEVRVCVECGGLWMDSDATRRVLTGRISAAAIALGDHAEGAVRSTAENDASRAFRRPAPTGACPTCQTPLARIVTELERHGVGGLELDICAVHGTWFDAHELHILAKAAKIKRENDSADIAQFESSTRDVANVAGFVSGALSAVFYDRNMRFRPRF